MPNPEDVAEMLREDLEAARQRWLQSVEFDQEEFQRRQASDFLLAVNGDGENFDFHCLRHTCGPWLAKAGAHPNGVKAVMRHSTIILTMDTSGHLFPGQEADTVARFPRMFQASASMVAEARENDKSHVVQHVGNSDMLSHLAASSCTTEVSKGDLEEDSEGLVSSRVSTNLHRVATKDRSAPSRTRTENPLIKSPSRFGCKSLQDNSYDNSKDGFAQGVAQTRHGRGIDADLARVIEAWPTLPEAVKAGIVAMVAASSGTGD